MKSETVAGIIVVLACLLFIAYPMQILGTIGIVGWTLELVAVALICISPVIGLFFLISNLFDGFLIGSAITAFIVAFTIFRYGDFVYSLDLLTDDNPIIDIYKIIYNRCF